MSSNGNSNSNSSSKPRPIHQLHRELRSNPDEAEPSYSYEQESFLVQREDEHEDAFHRRNNHNLSRRDSSASQNSANNNNNRGGGGGSDDGGLRNSGSAVAGGGVAVAGTNGSFWRVEALQKGGPVGKSAVMHSSSGQQQQQHQQPKQQATRTRSQKGNKKQSAKSSVNNNGGDTPTSLLGAALNAASTAPTSTTTPSSEPPPLEVPAASPTFQRTVSSKKKKDISKQRQAERRHKIETQTEHDLGHLVAGSSSSSSNNLHPVTSPLISAPAATATTAMASNNARANSNDTLPEHNNDTYNPHGSFRQVSDSNSAGGRSNVNHSAGTATTSAASSLPAATAAAGVAASNGGEADTGSTPFGWGADTSASLSVADVSTTDTAASTTTGTRSVEGSSLLFGKPSNGSVLLGKSSSLIFPTGVEPSTSTGRGTSIGSVGRGSSNASSSDYAANNLKRRKVNLLLDQCETVRFPFKKKLILSDLGLTAADIPVKDLCGTPLGQSLHKLSLAGNRLGYIPGRLVSNLPVLKHLDLSQCELHHLPETWLLPNLRRLNLSHNRLTDFPEEGMLEGLPELQELNMYGNKVAEIVIPHSNASNKKQVLSKLETLNLGYNDLSFLPDDLDLLKSLRTLKVMNNFLEKVPIRVCDMDLRMIDVSSNPVIQPPIETCERGISSMKRYYHQLRLDDIQAASSSTNNQGKSSSYYDEFQKNVKKTKKKVSYGLLKAPKLLMPGVQRTPSTNSQPPAAHATRQASDEASMSQSSVATAPSGINQPQFAHVPSSITSSPTHSEDHRKFPAVAARSKSEGATPAISATPQSNNNKVQVDEEGPITPQRASYSLGDSAESSVGGETHPQHHHQEHVHNTESITVNDTLKVIFVGMAMVGKTSMIKRLIEGEDAIIPSHDDRTVGVDIYEWDNRKDKRFEHIDSRIVFEDKELEKSICAAKGIDKHNVDVKFSVWDFAGQHVYHATHQLFFSPRALYVLVWDMGATNRGTLRRKNSRADERGAFKLSYDSSDEEESEVEEDDDFDVESEARRSDRALDRDIDEKVQFWVDCIQSSAPGAAILPVASFNDHFSDSDGGVEEAKRRCRVMKNRLLRHEERRIEGIKQRLKEYHDSNRANDEGAVRLQKLLDSYTRPKLIFWGDDDPVIRVSGSMYTGFDDLTRKIIDIATGRYKGQWQHPIFRGHIGVRIPRMRLEVREAVRTLRNRFKVVEWGYFLDQLKDRGLTSVEDISDALHFLTNVGELSYFGAVYTDKETKNTIRRDERRKNARAYHRSTSDDSDDDDLDDDDFDDDYEEGGTLLSVDDTDLAASAQITEESSLTNSLADWNVNGLSQFVFLNPRWLVAAVACILRHDLDREIQETRRSLDATPERSVSVTPSFYDAHLNCPVITARDAKMLWQAKKITKKAADRALKASSNMSVTPFEFLLLLLIRFGVFVPIDLSIDKALLGGKDYAGQEDDNAPSGLPSEVSIGDTTTTAPTTTMAKDSPLQAKFFFLPSLLGPGEPAEAWTYKNSESWKITLAHSVLFPDGVPPGLMERITASVLSNVYAAAHKSQQSESPKGRLSVKEVLCWRTAFYLKLGTQSTDNKESMVEIFTHLVDRDSELCVGSDYMGIGMRRLITSAKGQVGDRGRKIWEGGYLLVVQSVRQVMEEYGGLEFERQAFCTDCLAKSALSRTSAWDFTVIRSAIQNGDGSLRCRDGHRVDTSLIAGPSNMPKRAEKEDKHDEHDHQSGQVDPIVPVKDLLRGVVVVGLFDGKTRKVVRVGSGFIVDKKRGLIVTASHTLMNIWGDKNTPFGDNYYGLRQGKVVIGIIPRQKEAANNADSTMALFRYFAVIVAKDPSIDRGECHLDACVLRITTRMENDIGGDGDGCGDQPERLLLNNPDALKKEKLQPLKITEKVELDEQVRILGYNQGGEGLLGPGQSLNRYVDFARGYVCKMFSGDISENDYQRHRFKPRKEIVVICPTIGGHSGGPCVNQQGEVIGILSRADPAESQRCYLVPTNEWKGLVKQAKNMI